jgi:Plasmid encoded RepA protein
VTTPTKPLRSPLFSATQIAFIEEATQIEQQAAQKAGTVGYLARMLVQVTMPHAKQSSHEFTRTNGGFSVTMLAASQYGLPYGTVPRLLLAWMTTEVVRTKEATLTLGRSLSEFLRRLGYTPTGGKTGSIGRINRQMEALFRCMVSWNYRDKTRSAGQNILLVDEYELAWDPKQDNQEALWTSTVTLGKRFFDEISQRPVPIDMRALRALRGSSMRLDIYSWLTYRMSYLEQPTTIPWEALQGQFGADYPLDVQGLRDFKKSFLLQLRAVLTVYSSARVQPGEKGLTLLPSPTHVLRAEQVHT